MRNVTEKGKGHNVPRYIDLKVFVVYQQCLNDISGS